MKSGMCRVTLCLWRKWQRRGLFPGRREKGRDGRRVVMVGVNLAPLKESSDGMTTRGEVRVTFFAALWRGKLSGRLSR